MWAHQPGLSLIKADLAKATDKNLIYQQQRPTLRPRHGTPSQRELPATWWKLITLDLFIMKGAEVHRHWNRHIFWIWVCLSCL